MQYIILFTIQNLKVKNRHEITKKLLVQSWAKVTLRNEEQFASPVSSIKIIQPFMHEDDKKDIYDELQKSMQCNPVDTSTYFFSRAVDTLNNWEKLLLEIDYWSKKLMRLKGILWKSKILAYFYILIPLLIQ